MSASNNPSFITKRENLRELLTNNPDEVTEVLCVECFTPVHRAALSPGATILFCECYARVFEPGNDRHLNLTTRHWAGYIQTSRQDNPIGYQLRDALDRGEAKGPIINQSPLSNYDIWCPGCGRDRKIAGKGIWVNELGTVCVYGLCRPCMTAQGDNQTQLCEDRLLEHFPFLQSRIPRPRGGLT
jgi:hypothetical protein